MHQFNEGDIVRVKCGGPDMTVVCVDEHYFADDDAALAVFCVYEKTISCLSRPIPSTRWTLCATSGDALRARTETAASRPSVRERTQGPATAC